MSIKSVEADGEQESEEGSEKEQWFEVVASEEDKKIIEQAETSFFMD